MQALTGKDLWMAAADWGSYMHAGDPGACMYGFTERGAVRNEEHRQACLAYLRDTLSRYPWSKRDVRHLHAVAGGIALAPMITH